MNRKQLLVLLVATTLLAIPGFLVAGELTPEEQLGKFLFFDDILSNPITQSCATCHAPEAGFTGPDSIINDSQAIYPGAVHTRAGNRKPPTAAYGGDSPVLDFNEVEGLWIGGMFWDGRATGWNLGDPLAEQALGPFLNPLEQNLPMARLVVKRVANSEYAPLFEKVWGPGTLDFVNDVEKSYELIGRSIAEYERSSEVNPFTSKYDFYLAGDVKLTEDELEGLRLFEEEGKCSLCHLSRSENNKPLFTDFTFDNLGVPKNPSNPFYSMPRKWNPDGENWVDYGLGGFLKSAGYGPAVYEPELGKQKVPTLRNVDRRPYDGFVKAYGHNGFFKSLKDIVHFYNTRDIEQWPLPEVAENVNDVELGNLGLTDKQEDLIVEFMKTLSDGYIPPIE